MSDWIPLLQTLVWAGLVAAILFLGRGNWGRIMQAIERRISQGDDMTLRGPLGVAAELKREARGLPRLKPSDDEMQALPTSDPSDLSSTRARIGADQRGVHLVHVVAPSDEPGQRYDIFAYLHGWGRDRFELPANLADVVRAEFFLGPKFNPSSVTVENHGDGRIGFVTSAHAPALCLCKVTFSDGHEATLSRYLDFESGDLAQAASAPAS